MDTNDIATDAPFGMGTKSGKDIRLYGFMPDSGGISEIIFSGYGDFFLPCSINGFQMNERQPSNGLREFVLISHGIEYWIQASSMEIKREP
jgi:hypothetical protein